MADAQATKPLILRPSGAISFSIALGARDPPSLHAASDTARIYCPALVTNAAVSAGSVIIIFPSFTAMVFPLKTST